MSSNPLNKKFFYDENDKICYYDESDKLCYNDDRLKNLTFGDDHFSYIENGSNVLNIVMGKSCFKFENFSIFIHDFQFPYNIILLKNVEFLNTNFFYVRDSNGNLYKINFTYNRGNSYNCISIELPEFYIQRYDKLIVKYEKKSSSATYNNYGFNVSDKCLLISKNGYKLYENYPVDEIKSIYISKYDVIKVVYSTDNNLRELLFRNLGSSSHPFNVRDSQIIKNSEKYHFINFNDLYLVFDDEKFQLNVIKCSEKINESYQGIMYINDKVVKFTLDNSLRLIDIVGNVINYLPINFNQTIGK